MIAPSEQQQDMLLYIICLAEQKSFHIPVALECVGVH